MPGRAVIDASVAAKWLWMEVDSRAAEELSLALERDKTLPCAPDLLLIELHNVLQRRVRRGDLPPDVPLLKSAPDLGLDFEWYPSVPLLSSALDICLHHNVTIYDALYAALAREIRAPLYTADKVFYKAMKTSNVKIHCLGLEYIF